MEFSFKDTLRTAVEIATDGKNTVMYDEYDNPNMMVCIPVYDKSALGLSNGTHPAFILDDDTEVREIWVSKYMNVIGNGGVGISIPRVVPSKLTFKDAKTACAKKGRGWHLITNIEWSAIASNVAKRGLSPREAKWDGCQTTTRACLHRTEEGEFTTGAHVAGGALNHDGKMEGICDMQGLYREHVDGIYVSDGKKRQIYVHGNGKVPQNRFRDNKYYATGWCYDWSSGTNYLGLDDLDTVYHEGNNAEMKYVQLKSFYNHMDGKPFPEEMILHNVCPYKGYSGKAYAELSIWNDAKTKLGVFRGFATAANACPDILDLSVKSFIEGPSADLGGFRAVYIDY